MLTFVTYVGTDRLRSLDASTPGRALSGLLQRCFSGGTVTVRGGAGYGLVISSEHLRLDHEHGYGLVRGVLEPEVQEALRRLIHPGDTVWDVGANIGFFTVLSAARVGPEGRVIAFEPVPTSADAVAANAALNGFEDRVEIRQEAVSDWTGTGRLCLPWETSWAHLRERGLHPDSRTELEVSVRTLDSLIAQAALAVPRVIKIDVEGSELAVLAGCRETLLGHDIAVICELHGTGAEVHSFMHEVGYIGENLEGPGDPGLVRVGHVLFRPAPPAWTGG